MNKIDTRMLSPLSFTALLAISNSAMAFPNNNFFGSNNGCGNDWPVWTPMYWMEEMSGSNNNNCYPSTYRGYPQQQYPASPYSANAYQASPYQGYYQQSQQLPYSAYGLRQSPAMYSRLATANPWAARSAQSSSMPFNNMWGNSFSGNRSSSAFSPFSRGFSSNPFSSMSSGGFGTNPFSSMSPMGGFGSPMGMNSMGMSPMGMGVPGMSPLGGMGMSPMSGMSPMGGMSPFGSSPFGGSSFMPRF